MQMLDSRNDNAPSGASYNNIPDMSDGYDAPASSYQAPQQSYQAPKQAGYTPPRQPPKMPENNLPEIDIDEDEIPF